MNKISEIRAMTIACRQVNGLNMAQGLCDLPVPEIVKQGAIKAIRNGHNTYTATEGIKPLRYALAERLNKYNKINIDPDKNIIISNGATGAFYCTCVALLKPEDEVLIFEPYYSYHLKAISAVGAKPKFISMLAPDWSFNLNDNLVSAKTKAIVINTPSNPAGKVFSKNDIRLIAEFAVKHDLWIISDEIYEYFIYGEQQHFSPGSLAMIKDRTITISGYSKTFSITGWRIGYAICQDEALAEKIKVINDTVYVCSPTPLQVGVATGITSLPEDYYLKIRQEMGMKRDQICEKLHQAGLIPYVPAGAYYILADISKLPGDNCKEKVMFLLNQGGIATVPGTEFFNNDGGNNLARFCFAKNDADIETACQRLESLVISR